MRFLGLALGLILVTLPVAALAAAPSLCPGEYQALAPAPSPAQQSLQALKKYVDSQRNEMFPHRLEVKGGLGVLHIGFLRRGDSTFLRLFVRAIKEGALSEIQVGEVVGPKALSFLQQLRDLKLAGAQKIRMTGEVTPENLLRAFRSESEFAARRTNDPRRWTPKDAEDFQIAVKKFGIDQACQGLLRSTPEQCGRLLFETTLSNQPAKIKWRK